MAENNNNIWLKSNEGDVLRSDAQAIIVSPVITQHLQGNIMLPFTINIVLYIRMN